MTERVLDSARADRVAIVRRALTAFLDDDLDAALALASPEIIAVRMPPLPDAQVYRGREGSSRCGRTGQPSSRSSR